MCEAGINIKVIRDTLGHKDISTTMNIYTDATKELKIEGFRELDMFLKKHNEAHLLFNCIRHLRQNLRRLEHHL